MTRGSVRTARVVAAVALAVFGAAIAFGACGGSRMSEPTATYDRIDARKEEIRELWMQIREWRVGSGLAHEPSDQLKQFVHGVALHSLELCSIQDVREPSEACVDICNLADAICDNAERICDIAADLAGDTWAAEKCASAKASCKEANERCCECIAGGA